MRMPTLEEAQSQLNYEVAVYREQLNMLKRETERISLTTLDLTNALRTVENLGAERVLMPIGGGALIKGKTYDTKVLVPIGGEYLVEMDKQAAATEINRRIEATKKALEKLNAEFGNVMNKLRDVSGKLEDLQTQVRISERAEENVHEDYI